MSLREPFILGIHLSAFEMKVLGTNAARKTPGFVIGEINFFPPVAPGCEVIQRSGDFDSQRLDQRARMAWMS